MLWRTHQYHRKTTQHNTFLTVNSQKQQNCCNFCEVLHDAKLHQILYLIFNIWISPCSLSEISWEPAENKYHLYDIITLLSFVTHSRLCLVSSEAVGLPYHSNHHFLNAQLSRWSVSLAVYASGGPIQQKNISGLVSSLLRTYMRQTFLTWQKW